MQTRFRLSRRAQSSLWFSCEQMKGSHQGIPWKSGGIRPDGATESREETRARNTSPTALGCPGRAGSTDGTACGILRSGRGAPHSARLDPPIVFGTSSRHVPTCLSQGYRAEGAVEHAALEAGDYFASSEIIPCPWPSRSRAPWNSRSSSSPLCAHTFALEGHVRHRAPYEGPTR